MVSGGAGACRSRSRREAIAEPGELDLSGLAVDQDMRRLEVLVDEATLVRLAQGGGDAETEAQEASQLQGRAEQAVERLSAGILKHQRHTAVIVRKRYGSRRPVGVKFGLERIFRVQVARRNRARFLLRQQAGSASSRCQSPGIERRRPRAATRIRSPRARSRRPPGRRITLRH